MTKLSPKTIGVGVVFLALIGYIVFSLFSGPSPTAKLTSGQTVASTDSETQDHRVPSVITDPFFHPSVQEVAPSGAPDQALSGPAQSISPGPRMSGGINSGNAPLQPMPPMTNDPYNGSAPGQPSIQPLPGTLPAELPGRTTPPVSTPNQVVNQPDPEVKVQVQGLVVGSAPSAFVKVNDGSGQKVTAGSKLEGGIVIVEISEQTVTFSRKGKKTSLRPGQVENL